MAGTKALQISSRKSDAPLTLEQQRFNFLIAKIEELRAERTKWEASVLAYDRNNARQLEPLRASLRSAGRDTVFAVDGLLEQPGWSKSERAALRDMLREMAGALLEVNADDAGLKTLFDKHSEMDFDTGKQEELRNLKAQAEAATGLNLGDDDEIRSEEDLVQRMYERMAQLEAAEEARKAAKQERQKGRNPAHKRASEDAKLAQQSLREIYRKLASAVHPDREPDPVRREAKNALMQKINQAYAANDLLTLFQAQMQLEQIDSGHIGKMSAQRLKQYNKLLAEQLANSQAAIVQLHAEFCARHGLEPIAGLTPQKLTLLTRREARHLRAELAQQQKFLTVLADKAAVRRWLKYQRRVARDLAAFDEDLFDQDL